MKYLSIWEISLGKRLDDGGRGEKGLSQLCDPHPKSLSLRAMDFEIWLPFSLREKGLGDEGTKFAKVGCTQRKEKRMIVSEV